MMEETMEVHIRRLQRVYEVAAKSPDQRTQVGSVLYDAFGNKLAEDYNRPVVEVDIAILLDRYNKRHVLEHSERNVIRGAIKRYGTQAVRGSTLYTNWMPCCDCARELIDFGVSTLVIDERNAELASDYWLSMFDWSETQLLKANVMIIRIKEDFPHQGFLFDGELISR
jgi:tRNA(Arg) A34 adenosine deaminase TadA